MVSFLLLVAVVRYSVGFSCGRGCWLLVLGETMEIDVDLSWVG